MMKLLEELNTLTNTISIFYQYDYETRLKSIIYNALVEKADRLTIKLQNNKEYNKLLMTRV